MRRFSLHLGRLHALKRKRYALIGMHVKAGLADLVDSADLRTPVRLDVTHRSVAARTKCARRDPRPSAALDRHRSEDPCPSPRIDGSPGVCFVFPLFIVKTTKLTDCAGGMARRVAPCQVGTFSQPACILVRIRPHRQPLRCRRIARCAPGDPGARVDRDDATLRQAFRGAREGRSGAIRDELGKILGRSCTKALPLTEFRVPFEVQLTLAYGLRG